MSDKLPNRPVDIDEMLASFTSEHEAKTMRAIRSVAGHGIEAVVLAGGNATAVCGRCTKDFQLTVAVDDWNVRTITGGVRIRGAWICDSCEFDEVQDYLFDLELERAEPFSLYDDPTGWVRLEDSQDRR